MHEPTDSDLRFAKGRLEALSDGIFAVAMTLMAFEIKVPDLPKSVAEGELIAALKALMPAVRVYLMAFTLLGAYWLLHHTVYHFIKHIGRAQIVLGLVFLLFVMLQPFSTSLLAHYMHHRIASQVYYGNLLAIGVLLLAQWWLATRSDPAVLGTRGAKRIGLGVASFVAGAVAALIGARWSEEVASVCLLGGIVAVRLFARSFQRASARVAA